MRTQGINLNYVLALAASLALGGCANMEEFTESIENFTKRVQSQNTLMNHSRISVTGEYATEDLSITTAESHLLTPVQLNSVREDLKYRGIQAYQRGDTQESRALSDVSSSFEEQFKTQNDVIVFKLENKTYDPIDLSEARILVVDENQRRIRHAIFPERGLEFLNEKAFFVDRADNGTVEYTNGKLTELPALTTEWKAIIVPGLRAGSYQAVLSGLPEVEGRVVFNIHKQ